MNTCAGVRILVVLWCSGCLVLWHAGWASAQTLVALDDSYAAPAGQSLVVDPRGVLENDTDGIGEDLPPTATVELRVDASNGALVLSADGSFTYTPESGFSGTDTFTYRALDGAEFSNDAVVAITVTGCTTGLPLLTCWVEADYIAKLQELGYGTLQEGFEDDATWGVVRTPDTAPAVTGTGITWSSNNATSEITTGSGPARSGMWGFFSIPHGDLTGGPTDPIRDGFSGMAEGTLVAVGAWLSSNTGGARVQFILTDQPNPPVAVDFADPHVTSAHKFFGVIDTRGFSTFEIFETEGVVEDQEFIFADDFTFGTVACGNGILDGGEACDDGNAVGGDCCSAACEFEAAGAPCSDGSACTSPDTCDGAGTCTAGPCQIGTGCGQVCGTQLRCQEAAGSCTCAVP